MENKSTKELIESVREGWKHYYGNEGLPVLDAILQNDAAQQERIKELEAEVERLDNQVDYMNQQLGDR